MKAGTKTLSVTAAAIGSNQPAGRVYVQADPANSINAVIGDALTQTYVLAPGDSVALDVGDVGLIFAKAASAGTPIVNWIEVP